MRPLGHALKNSCCVRAVLPLFNKQIEGLLAAHGGQFQGSQRRRFPKIQSSIVVFGDLIQENLRPTHNSMSKDSKNDNNNTATADYGSGYLEISEKGFGFLRTAQNHRSEERRVGKECRSRWSPY